MSDLDTLRVQVDELKQRLCPSDNQPQIAAEDIQTLSTSIKATMQCKQDEIDRLTIENEQLRRMLGEAMSAANEYDAGAAENVLRDFYAEMVAFIDPGEAANAADGKEPTQTAEPDTGTEQKQPAVPQQSPPAATTEQDETLEDTPVLRRIMRRGQRAR